jgi:hypothetical protein
MSEALPELDRGGHPQRDGRVIGRGLLAIDIGGANVPAVQLRDTWCDVTAILR